MELKGARIRQQQEKKSPAKRSRKPKAYHHGDLRQTLIDAAIKMLTKSSPDSLSLRDLARQAGVSIAAPYRHFKDKRELLAAISAQGFELKHKYMCEEIKKSKNKPLDMYYACAISYFRMGLKHPQHFKLMFASEVMPSEEFPELLKSACKTFQLLRRMIEYCQNKGLIGSGNSVHKALNCWCVVNGFTSLYAEGRLAWLGVDDKNAESALKTLLSQYLVGNREPLSKSDFGFIPLESSITDPMIRVLLDTPDPEAEALFANKD